MVWGGVSQHHRTELVVIAGNLNTVRYREDSSLMRTADVARAINCNVRPVRLLRQHYRETGRTADRPHSGRPHVTTHVQDRYIRTSHLRDRYRMATTPVRVTPGTHNPSISVQTVRNMLRVAGLRACRPVVRQVLTRHHR